MVIPHDCVNNVLMKCYEYNAMILHLIYTYQTINIQAKLFKNWIKLIHVAIYCVIEIVDIAPN